MKKAAFKALPFEYQAAIAIDNLDNEDFYCLCAKEDPDSTRMFENCKFRYRYHIKKLVALYLRYLETVRKDTGVYLYGVESLDSIKEKILPVIERYGTFENYRRAYGNGSVHKVRVAVIVNDSDPEYIIDGWHRFHGYITSGDREIKVVAYDKRRA